MYSRGMLFGKKGLLLQLQPLCYRKISLLACECSLNKTWETPFIAVKAELFLRIQHPSKNYFLLYIFPIVSKCFIVFLFNQKKLNSL